MSDVEKVKRPSSARIADEVLVSRHDRFSNRNEFHTVTCIHMELKGRMAAVLIEKWGLVAGTPDGEDSAGRTSLRLLEPDEVVERACRTAHLAVDRFKQLGWIHEIPEHLLLGDSEEE